MAEIIYSKNGEMKCTAKSVRYTGSFMGVPQLEVNIESPVPVTLMVGDYIVFSYDGIRYSIIDLPQVQKQSSSGSVGNAFVYENVVFKSPLGLLSSIDFLDTVLSDNNIHYSTLPVFSFFGDIKDFADRLQANLNRIYSSGWKVTVEGYDDSSNSNYDILHDYKEISLSNQNCLDALGIPYETWKITYVFALDDSGNNCIIFNHALDSASYKRYGKGNGLYSLTKRMSAEKPVITRLRAYGGTDNLPARYYNKQSGISKSVYLPNLMIPRSKWKNQNDPVSAYIDSTDVDSEDTSMSRYGIREKSVYFDGSGEYDEIIPTIKGMTAKMIRDAKAEMQDESNIPSNTIYPDSERMDKIVAAESITDNGVENTGEVYTDSVILVLPKGTDGNLGFTKNGEFVLWQEFMTETTVSVPAFYKFTPSQSYVLKIPIETPFSNPFLISTAVLNIYVSTSDGSKQLCGSVSMTYETSARDRMFYLYLSDGDFFVKIPYVGTLSFEIVFEGSAYEVSNDYAYTWQSVRLSMSQGPLILQERFWVRIKQIGFDINSYPSTEEARLVVNSGGCAGRSFNIMKNSTKFDADTETWQFECFRTLDESLNQKFPNSIYAISPDDEFVLTGLNMPDLYVEIASQKLYEEATKLLLENKGGLEIFDLDIDSKVAHTDSVKIKEGMLMPLYDDDLGIGKTAADGSMEYEYRIIDSITIEIGDETLPVISVVLREDKEASVFKSLMQRVQSVSSSTSHKAIRTQVVRIAEEVSRANTVPASQSMPMQDTSDFVTLSTEQTITGKKTFANDVVFGGAVSDGVYGKLLIPSTAGPGIYGLLVSDEPVQGEVPSGSGGLDKAELWLELGGSTDNPVIGKDHLPGDTVYTDDLAGYALKSELPDLTPYATQEWVTGQGYATQTWVKGLGYLTATDADKRYVNIAGDTMTGLLHGTDIELSGHISAATLYVPYSGGSKIYSLSVSDTPVQGEAPSGGGGLDSAALWEELGGNATDKVIGLSRIPDIPVDMVSGLLGGDSRILPSLLPDWLMGQLLYGGTVDGSSVATVSAAFKDRYGADGDTVTLNASNASQYEGVYFIASADASSGVVQSLGVRTGDWVVSNGLAWTKIDNTDSVSSVAGLTGVISKGALQTALSDSTHRFVTDAQTAAWDGKWAWDEEDIKAVKVNAAALADKAKALNAARSLWGQSFDGTGDVDGDMSGVGGITMSGSIAGAVNADFSGYLSAGTLYIPYSGGSKVYSLKVSDAPVSGESPSGGGGLDVDAMWDELEATDASKVIDASHIPLLDMEKVNGLPTALSVVNASLNAMSEALQDKADISDIPSLSGYINSVTTSGAGNAVTGYAKSGNTLTLVKGTTFLTSVPAATSSAYGGIKIGYPESGKNYPVELDSSGRAYVSVPWTDTNTNTTYTLTKSGSTITLTGSDGSKTSVTDSDTTYSAATASSAGLMSAADKTKLDGIASGANKYVHPAYTSIASGFNKVGRDATGHVSGLTAVTKSDITALGIPGSLSDLGITATAAEINKLDGVGTLLHSGNYTSYTVTKTGGGASGTWPISISGNAATADISNYLFLNPNNGIHASQNDAVPANGRFAIYDVNKATTAGGNDGYIMAFRWPSGNFVTQVFLDADNTGIMALRHRSDSNVWTDWSRILHSSNIGSYALTPSNYASTLDSRYVNISGDTMTGTLNISSSYEALIRYQISGSNKAASGYHASQGAYLYSWPAGKYLHITDSGLLLFGSSTVWHSGNDGSGSGIDADLLDGYQASSFLLKSGGTMTGNLTLKSMGGLWLGGKTQAPIMTNGASSITGNTYHPVIWGKTDAGDVWNLGHGASDQVGFFGFYSERTDNGTDWAHYIKVSDGTVHFNKTVYGTTFSTGNITPSAAGSYNIGTASLWYERIYGRYIDTASGYDLRLCTGGVERLTIQASSGYVGIGTTSPAYKLDVAGEIRATSGITIGGTDDIGWYWEQGSRLGAGDQEARGVNVGSLLVSNAWADYTKVPTNGIYSKGNILSAGNIIAYSSSSRLVKDILPKRTTFSQRLTALGSVVDYRYNNVLKRDRDAHIGLIYENVRDTMPGMCHTHEGYGALNYLDTDYINLIAGSVQEHTDEIVHLKNKVASLEAEVARLRRGLAA